MAFIGPVPLPDGVLDLIEPLGDRDPAQASLALQALTSLQLSTCARALRVRANGSKATIARQIIAAGYGLKRPVHHLAGDPAPAGNLGNAAGNLSNAGPAAGNGGAPGNGGPAGNGGRGFVVPFDQFPDNLIDPDAPLIDFAVLKPDGRMTVDQLPSWAALSCGIFADRPVPQAFVDHVKAMVLDAFSRVQSQGGSPADNHRVQFQGTSPGDNQGGSTPSGAAGSEAARFSPPAGGLNPLQPQGLFAPGGGGGNPASGSFLNDRGAATSAVRQGLLPAFRVTAPGLTGVSGLAHPVISAFINSRQPIWAKASNGEYVRTVEMGLFQIKCWATACADLVAELQRLPGLTAQDKEWLAFCALQQSQIYRQTNLLVYFPDVANDYNEDKELADLGATAKKLRKLSAKDVSATAFITGPVAASAAPPPPVIHIAQAQQHYSQAGSFPPGSCPYHPHSTTHNVSTCREAKRSKAGGGGSGVAANGNGNPKSGAKSD